MEIPEEQFCRSFHSFMLNPIPAIFHKSPKSITFHACYTNKISA